MRTRLLSASWMSLCIWIAFTAFRSPAQGPAGSGEADFYRSLASKKWPATRITGVVRNQAGAPVAGVVVAFIPGFYSGANPYSETISDSDGRYELVLAEAGLGPMRGAVVATNLILARGFELNLAAIDSFFEIPGRLDLTLRPGITLSGSVRDADGAPITNATVSPLFIWGRYSFGLEGLQGAKIHPVRIDAQGRFSIPALPQGLEYYFIQTHIIAEGYGSISASIDAELTHTNHYEFPPFVLKRANLVVAGQVLGADGKPVTGVTLNLTGVNQRLFNSAESDSQGRFEFKDVVAGPVKVSTSQRFTPGKAVLTHPITVEANGGDTNIILSLRNP